MDGSARGEQVLGDFTMAGSNFDPAMLIFPRKRNLQTLTVPTSRDSQRTLFASKWRRGMWRNANGARDLCAPVKLGEEGLAKPLAGARAKTGARGPAWAATGAA